MNGEQHGSKAAGRRRARVCAFTALATGGVMALLAVATAGENDRRDEEPSAIARRDLGLGLKSQTRSRPAATGSQAGREFRRSRTRRRAGGAQFRRGSALVGLAARDQLAAATGVAPQPQAVPAQPEPPATATPQAAPQPVAPSSPTGGFDPRHYGR